MAHLHHNDYICHGAIGSDIRRVLKPGDTEARLVRESYEMVCTHTLQFLDAFLKGDTRAAEILQRSAAGRGTDAERFSLRRLEAAPLPPTGEQLAHLALAEGAGGALTRCASLDADLREDALNGAGYVLLRQGLCSDAILLFERAAERYSSSANAHDSLGEAHAEVGDTAAAIHCYERAEGLLAADTSPSERTSRRLEQVRLVLNRLRGASQGSAEESSAGPASKKTRGDKPEIPIGCASLSFFRRIAVALKKNVKKFEVILTNY